MTNVRQNHEECKLFLKGTTLISYIPQKGVDIDLAMTKLLQRDMYTLMKPVMELPRDDNIFPENST